MKWVGPQPTPLQLFPEAIVCQRSGKGVLDDLCEHGGRGLWRAIDQPLRIGKVIRMELALIWAPDVDLLERLVGNLWTTPLRREQIRCG